MATQTQTDFMEIVKGRRSIRNYDTDVKISKEEMTQILEEATLAPSSVNMQPWRFLVIDSEEGKATHSCTPREIQPSPSRNVFCCHRRLR